MWRRDWIVVNITTLNLAIPYICRMNSATWQHNSTAPLWIKILSWLTIATTAFFTFHLVILFGFGDQLSPATWITEIYFYVACFFPGFLVLTGSLNRKKKLARVLWIAIALYGICIALNIPNSHEIIEIYHLQFPTSIALLTMLIIYAIHFFQKEKNALDYVKFLWLFCFVYMYVVPKFVPGGHQAGWFLVGMQFIYPVMMTAGLIQFYRKPKPLNI